MNQYNAARAAGYSEATAKNHPSRLEKVINDSIQNALEQAGFTPSYRAKELFKLSKSIEAKTKLSTFKHVADLMGDVSSKIEHSGEIKTGETKIIIVSSKEENARISDRTSAVPAQISI